MGKYRKKPVVIDAVQMNLADDPATWPVWLFEAIAAGTVRTVGKILFYPLVVAEIATLEGLMPVDNGDWIIKGTRNELYSCKPDIFAETYEPVE